jgi:hypothetical protein
MNKLLYYPYISIPNSAWLTQALLYWDGIATIVPAEFLKRPRQFTSFARDLVNQGIIETVQPEEYAYIYYYEFLGFLDWAVKNQDHFKLSETDFAKQYNLHVGKLGFIATELADCGLARRVDDQWYMVNSQLSKAFMTFLAILIGQATELTPTTDTYQGMSSLFNIEKQPAYKNSTVVRNTLRNSILKEIMPIPKGVQNYAQILRYKDKYHDELVRFRRHIEGFIAVLDGLPNCLQKERRDFFILDAKDEIEQIKGHMQWFQTPSIEMGTIIPALSSCIDVISGNYLGTAVNLAGLLNETIINKNRNTNRNKPLAYAALYQSRFASKL